MATHHSKLNSPPVPPPAVLSPIQPHPQPFTYQCYPDNHTPRFLHPALLSIQRHPWSLTQQCYQYNHTSSPSPISAIQTTIFPSPSPSSVIQTTTPLVPSPAVLSRQPHSSVPHPAVLSRQPYSQVPYQQFNHPDIHTPGPSAVLSSTPLVPHPSVLLLRQPLSWSFTQQCYPCNHTLVPHPAVLSPR